MHYTPEMSSQHFATISCLDGVPGPHTCISDFTPPRRTGPKPQFSLRGSSGRSQAAKSTASDGSSTLVGSADSRPSASTCEEEAVYRTAQGRGARAHPPFQPTPHIGRVSKPAGHPHRRGISHLNDLIANVGRDGVISSADAASGGGDESAVHGNGERDEESAGNYDDDDDDDDDATSILRHRAETLRQLESRGAEFAGDDDDDDAEARIMGCPLAETLHMIEGFPCHIDVKPHKGKARSRPNPDFTNEQETSPGCGLRAAFRAMLRTHRRHHHHSKSPAPKAPHPLLSLPHSEPPPCGAPRPGGSVVDYFGRPESTEDMMRRVAADLKNGVLIIASSAAMKDAVVALLQGKMAEI